ncbi:beta-galactoside-binding lectin-like [Salvelinus sp. IW2-2015]|uniref:beta-galactoside-binding lectin-like n=1 Tax=Salvelinus sp. IW2-2015 TaxID=2691554 RepID=UPI000CEB009C|nr:beta-galactoside-binding lectin-like [Salvelinus alpinus]
MSGVVVTNMSFKVGQTLTITGIPNSDATNFVINVGNSEDDLALHMSFRFDQLGDTRTVVCNSYHGGKWFEEHREARFPFNQGEKFKINITFTKMQFRVALPDGSEIHFPNRQGDEKYKYMHFGGHVRIQGIEIS